MQRMFPRALVACINEGRQPDTVELACVTEKVWREARVACGSSGNRQIAAALAMTAMVGQSAA